MVARNTKLVQAVGYARRSTDMQERSIPDQQAYVEKWASEHGYRILRWFVDDAISGTSAKGRNAFEQMIASAENGRDFDTVLCYDISRFSRGGTNETGFYLHRLKLVGVDVLFTADGIPEGDEGELIQGVKSWQARQYSVKLARDSIRGQISNIKERKSAPGGPPPYGYDKQHLTSDGKVLRTLRWMQDGSKQEFGPDGKLLRVIARNIHVAKAKGDIVRYAPSTPDRVAVIRRIFDLCAQGYGIKYTAEKLNNEGIPTLTGAKWNSSNIAMMLRCPVYRGAIVYNKRTSGSLFGMDSEGRLRPKKGQGYKLNPQDDWLIVEDVHEPLVSKETFAAATQMRAKNREAAGKARSVSRTLASTLLVCKRCGHSFTTVRDKRCGDDYRKYTCSGYHRYGKIVCGLVNIPGVPLDAFLLETIRRVIFNDPAKRSKVIDTFVKGMLAPATATKGSANLERELGQLDRRIKTTVNMLADLSFEGLDDLNRVLIDLKSKRDALVAKLATRQTTPDVLPTERELRSWANEQLQRLEELAKKTKVELPDRQLVESYVDRIEVFPDTKTGVIVMHADLRSFFASSSTRVVGGDEPQTVDPATLVPEMLAKPATVTFKEASLKDVATWLQTELKTGVLLDRQQLSDEGHLVSDPVNDQLHDEPVYLLLDRLHALKLDWYMSAGLIHITTKAHADEFLVTVSYNLGDLLDAGYEASNILQAISECTSGQWEQVDGVGGELVLLGDVLFAKTTHPVHRELAGLLAALRKHGRRTFTNDPPQHEPLRAKLEQTISVDFQETALSAVIAELERLSGMVIRLDHKGLQEEGVRHRTPLTLKLTDQKLKTVFQVLLSQLHINWTLEDGALWISTVARIDESMKTAVFDVRDLCQDATESNSLQRAIESQTSSHWSATDGVGGKIVFALPGVMVVRQSEKVLDDVLRLLENYRLALKSSKPRPLRSIDPREVLTRYYRLPTTMATEVTRLLPELVQPDSWKSADHPDAPGTIRQMASKPGLLNPTAPISKDIAASANPIIDHSVVIIVQTRATHKEIGELIQRLEQGDALFEHDPSNPGFFGGGGGFGGQQGGFGGGFPSIAPSLDQR